MELEEDNVGKVHRISWLRKAAGDHTAMGDKLISGSENDESQR